MGYVVNVEFSDAHINLIALWTPCQPMAPMLAMRAEERRTKFYWRDAGLRFATTQEIPERR